MRRLGKNSCSNGSASAMVNKLFLWLVLSFVLWDVAYPGLCRSTTPLGVVLC